MRHHRVFNDLKDDENVVRFFAIIEEEDGARGHRLKCVELNQSDEGLESQVSSAENVVSLATQIILASK